MIELDTVIRLHVLGGSEDEMVEHVVTNNRKSRRQAAFFSWAPLGFFTVQRSKVKTS